ncbi:unnamed protein product, partial [Pylaiella littoralis]
LPDKTLHNHRACIEAAGPRIKSGCSSVGKLPEGSTVEGLYQSRMQELAESVVDLGKSSSVDFTWDIRLYGDQGVVPAGSGEGLDQAKGLDREEG